MSGPLKGIAQRRNDIFYVDPLELQVKAGWNCRDLSQPENQAHVRELAASIAEVGVLTPLVVFRGDNKIYVSDGHCRLAAALYCIHELKVPIAAVPVKTEGREANEADYALRQILDGKPKTAFELGQVCKRLVGFGWSVEKIAKSSGKSVAAINTALDLQGAPIQVQKMVESGRVSPSLAAKEVRAKGSGATEALSQAIDHAAARGSGKATARDMGGEAKTSRVNKLAYVGEIMERADIEDGGPGHTRITMTDTDWAALQKLLDI